MKIYKFVDSTNMVLHVIDEDGVSRKSCSIDDVDFKEWLAAGNIPLPSDG